LLLAVVLCTGTGASPGAEAAPIAEASGAVAGLALASRLGTRVEILSERTETAQVFANPSGTRTLEQYVWPQRARRDGQWVPIGTRLDRNTDGSVSPRATVTALRLSGGGKGPLVSAAADGPSWRWPGQAHCHHRFSPGTPRHIQR